MKNWGQATSLLIREHENKQWFTINTGHFVDLQKGGRFRCIIKGLGESKHREQYIEHGLQAEDIGVQMYKGLRREIHTVDGGRPLEALL